MALTPEVLKSNTTLTGLTDEQLATIATLSANDEASVVNTKIGEHHGLIENDVLTVTGVAKATGEKSYEYLKRVLNTYHNTVKNTAGIEAKIAEKEAKITELETAIASGKGTEAITQKLRDAEDQLRTLRTTYDTEKAGWEEERTGFANKLTSMQIGAEFAKAVSTLTFKAEYPESVQKILLETAQNKILAAYTPDWVDIAGVKTAVFRDTAGSILQNPANKLNPYTATELLTEQLKDVLDTGQKRSGAGSNNHTEGQPTTLASIAGAKSQIDADRMIKQHLLEMGLRNGSAEMAKEMAKIRTELSVEKLPIR